MQTSSSAASTVSSSSSISSSFSGSSGRAEKVPVRILVKSELNRVREKTQQLVTSIAMATKKKRTMNPEQVDMAFTELLQASGSLRAATEVLHGHQEFQKNIYELEVAIKEKDEQILQVSNVLRDCQNNMEKVIFEKAKPLLGKAVGQENLKPVDSKSCLDYAKKLSFSTAAPPGWHFSQGLEIPFPYKPPAPQESVMKGGHLYTKLEAVYKMVKAHTHGQELAKAKFLKEQQSENLDSNENSNNGDNENNSSATTEEENEESGVRRGRSKSRVTRTQSSSSSAATETPKTGTRGSKRKKKATPASKSSSSEEPESRRASKRPRRKASVEKKSYASDDDPFDI